MPVHGLCMNDLQWHRKGHDHGAALAEALGFTPLYLRYNSGLHVWDNGLAVAAGDPASAPLPADVKCCAAAATLAAQGSRLAQRLVGDGFVPLDSALGRRADSARTLAIPQAHQWIGHEMGRLELSSRPEVYERLKGWLQPDPA